MVHRIMNEMYSDTPDGLEGNEDCGQISAWCVLSALGFYPVTPGTTDFIIGTPLFPSATILLENGKSFTINAKTVSNKNFYIQSAYLKNSSKYCEISLNKSDFDFPSGIYIYVIKSGEDVFKGKLVIFND